MRATPLLLLLIPALAVCDSGTSGDTARPSADGPDATGVPTRVAATLHPIASLAGAVGGGAVDVTTILPPGAHPDTYEATPRTAAALDGADLVVRIGGAADQWLAEPEGVRELVLTDGLELREGNPHVWLDPILVRDSLLPPLVDALARVVPDSADAIRRRGAAMADSLTALDSEIRRTLSEAPSRRFIATHPAWTYFAERYGLIEGGVLHPSPGSELGTRELARLVDSARAEGAPGIIAEPQLGRAGAAALADELGARVAVADPVGGAGLEGREDYLSLMRYNARAFARALGGHVEGEQAEGEQGGGAP